MYEASRSTVLLEGEKSGMFSVEQGVAQGCSLSPILVRCRSSPERGCADIALRQACGCADRCTHWHRVLLYHAWPIVCT